MVDIEFDTVVFETEGWINGDGAPVGECNAVGVGGGDSDDGLSGSECFDGVASLLTDTMSGSDDVHAKAKSVFAPFTMSTLSFWTVYLSMVSSV